jgi:hnRNP-L/PTB/hephaestus splicing factor
MRGAKKHQAFLEMGDEGQATQMVNHYMQSQAVIRGRSIYIQFSNHRKLVTTDTHQSQIAISLAQSMMQGPVATQLPVPSQVPVPSYSQSSVAPQLPVTSQLPVASQVPGTSQVPGVPQMPGASQLPVATQVASVPPGSNMQTQMAEFGNFALGGVPGMGLMVNPAQESLPSSNPSAEFESVDGVPNSVLRIIVENMLYPITIDILYLIFSKFGTVLRIVTFFKNGQFHALLQYPDAESAASALAALNGQNVWNGCCMLRIDYSKRCKLEVREENDRARDFTKDTGEGYSTPADPLMAAYALQLGELVVPQTHSITNSAHSQWLLHVFTHKLTRVCIVLK